MTALATLSIFVALALVAFVSYQFGVTVSDYRRETARMNRRDDALCLWRDAFHDPRRALNEALEVLYRNDDGTLAKAIETAYAANTRRYETHLYEERTRATSLHRRAQNAEGLLARREAKLEQHRTRARKLHRRAQKAEGALRRLKGKVIKSRATGVLTAADYASFPRAFVEFHGGQNVIKAMELLEMAASRPTCPSLYLDDDAPRDEPAIECTKPNHHEGDHEGMSPNGPLTWPRKGFDRLLKRVGDSIPKAPMPPIPVNGYWANRDAWLSLEDTTADALLPTAKPLSDVGAKGPVTAMPGLDLSDLTRPLKCRDVLPGNENDPYDLPVTCSREKGHEGPHAGGTRGCTIEWGFFEPAPPLTVKPDFSGGILEEMSRAMNEENE